MILSYYFGCVLTLSNLNIYLEYYLTRNK